MQMLLMLLTVVGLAFACDVRPPLLADDTTYEVVP